MDDRRQNEQEVAEIFGRAAEAVADAARSLDRQEPRFRRQLLGITIGVGRSVALDRRLTTDEWERLEVMVRETFDARGNVRSEGGLRQWTNGNLQVLLEPTEHGDRLRMRTVHGSAQMLVSIGVGIIAVPPLVVAVAMVAGLPDIGDHLRDLAPMALLGAATLGVGIARLRGWARTRLRQMDTIAAWLRKQTP